MPAAREGEKGKERGGRGRGIASHRIGKLSCDSCPLLLEAKKEGGRKEGGG